MFGTGVIEGFFGPEWSWAHRQILCEAIKKSEGNFYIYAPKRDPYLRKSWQHDHPKEMLRDLKKLSAKCHEQKLEFGIGLSPFEIHLLWDKKTKQILKEKILKLEELDLDYLGLFFDDMRGSIDLADKQAEIVEFTRGITHRALLFCPTYYSNDPILDKVFGQRTPDYLEKIGKNISGDVQILWTGNKVIPAEITAEELRITKDILKRKPFIWENYFANDGPKQCKFLKLKPFEGRDRQVFEAASGWAFNLMNQPGLSEILFESAVQVLTKGEPPEKSFKTTLEKKGGLGFAEIILEFGGALREMGLDKMEPAMIEELRRRLSRSNRFAIEILDWLDGKYIVGPECLTD